MSGKKNSHIEHIVIRAMRPQQRVDFSILISFDLLDKYNSNAKDVSRITIVNVFPFCSNFISSRAILFVFSGSALR